MTVVFLPCFFECADILSYLSNVSLRIVVCGSLFRVSKGVRDIPGNFQSATSNIPSGKALMYFGLFMATGVFFIFMAFTLFLPVIVLVPQKFAICFALGCSFIIGSFFALRGPKNQFAHMFSMEVFSFSPYCWSVLLSVYGLLSSDLFSSPSSVPEASFYTRIHRQHDGHTLCFHGTPQLYPFSPLFCASGIYTFSVLIFVSSVLFLFSPFAVSCCHDNLFLSLSAIIVN